MRTLTTILLLIVCIAKAPAQSLGNSRMGKFAFSAPFSRSAEKVNSLCSRSTKRFELAVALIKRFEGWHASRQYPYIVYGHCIQPGEHFRLPLTRRQADSLLRNDLSKLCRIFSYLGKDSLLIATLAYNVGPGTLLGSATRSKSDLIRKLERGDRNIRSDYLRYCRWNGKVVPSIRKRRKVEFQLLYEN